MPLNQRTQRSQRLVQYDPDLSRRDLWRDPLRPEDAARGLRQRFPLRLWLEGLVLGIRTDWREHEAGKVIVHAQPS